MARFIIEIPVEVPDDLAPERAVAELEHMAWRQLSPWSFVTEIGNPTVRPAGFDYST